MSCNTSIYRINILIVSYFRLNKIGKNPNLVAHREEDQGSESKTISAVVNALAAEADNVDRSVDSVNLAGISPAARSLHQLGKTLQKLSLPRPKSGEINLST